MPYAELNIYGVLLRSELNLLQNTYVPRTGLLFITPDEVIRKIGRCLRLADQYFRWASFSGNVSVTTRFLNVLHQPLRYSGMEQVDKGYTCSDPEFSVEEWTTTEALKDDLTELVFAISRQSFWAFNCEFESLAPKVAQVLEENRLI